MTTNAQITQWLTPLTADFATMNPVRHAFSVDDAPTTGGDFVTLLLTRVYGGPTLNDGSRPSGLWRLIVRAVGVGESNANTLLDRASAVIENRRITIGSAVSSGAEFETQEVAGEDEIDSNLWSAMRAFTYGFDAQ